MKVRWTQKAEDDLTGQCAYIACEDPNLATRIGAKALARVSALSDHPYRGRAGRVEGTRELSLPGLPWIAVYAIRMKPSLSCASSTARSPGRRRKRQGEEGRQGSR